MDERGRRVAEYTTPNGKVIATYIEPGTALFCIKFTTGGELPPELCGMFTSSYVANKTIEGYLSKVSEKSRKVSKDS